MSMTYAVALEKSWKELEKTAEKNNYQVRFLSDAYDIDLEKKEILSLSCNIAAQDFMAILLLHYLSKKIKGLPEVKSEWLTFREFSGIEGYYPAFRKRAIEPIIRKYGNNPKGILSVQERLSGKKIEGCDAGLTIDVFEGVPVMIKVWAKDEEFAADANIFFDKSIKEIFCIEDIIVLAGIIATSI